MAVKRSTAGVSLIELLMALLLFSIIASALFSTFRTTLSQWFTGAKDIKSSISLFDQHPVLHQQLMSSQRILDISLQDNTDGYLQFITNDQTRITLFLNSSDNQTRFSASNPLPTENLVAVYSRLGVSSNVEIVYPDINHFQLTSYKVSDPTLTSANNLASPVDPNAIVSLKFILSHPNISDTYEHLISLTRDTISTSGSIIYGSEETPFSSFSTEELGAFTTMPDEGGLFADALVMSHALKTVKIQNTGLYFSSIQSAINAAQPGDVILVGYREAGYTESLLLKSHISIKGGYNPKTWERNLSLWPTVIQTKAGFSFGSVAATCAGFNSDTIRLDGLTFQGADLQYGLYLNGCSNVSLSRISVDDADVALHISASNVDIENSDVTGNAVALSIQDSNTVQLERCRLYSHNLLEREAVQLKNSDTISLKNSLIWGGYHGVMAEASNSISLVNSIITKADNFGLFFLNCDTSQVVNSAIIENNIGAIVEPDGAGVIFSYSLFAENLYGPTREFSLENTTNLLKGRIAEWYTNNPFFLSLDAFELRESGDTMVDQGAPDIAFYDNYLSGSPGKGALRNDIGLYGGPTAGRVGPGHTISLSPLHSESGIQTALSLSYPGDMIYFEPGSYPFSSTLTFRHFQWILGYNASLNSFFNGDLITLADGVSLEGVSLIGTGTGTAILAQNLSHFDVTHCIARSFLTGLNSHNSYGNVRFSTMVDVSTGVLADANSVVTVNYSIFSAANTGIVNHNFSSLPGGGNVFHQCQTETSGAYSAQPADFSDQPSPLFWSKTDAIFELSPTHSLRSERLTPGTFESYHERLFLTCPTLTSDITRAYQTLSLSYGASEWQDTPLSLLSLALVSGEAVISSNPIMITTNATQDFTLSLGERFYADEVEVRLQLDTYRAAQSPFLDAITVQW